jgi:hypothetical protein
MENKNLSRKEFLSITGKTAAIGAAATLPLNAITATDLFAQNSSKTTSPPATIPQAQDEPIILEQWKSDVDQQTGPTPTPMPPEGRIRYAVVGLGHLALEEILPALSTCKKSRQNAKGSCSIRNQA